jgi:hypothetical protein
MWELNFFGLLLNLAGTPMLAFAFGKNPGGAGIRDDQGHVTYLASLLRPKLFWCGLLVMGVYALQLAVAWLSARGCVREVKRRR